MTVLWWAAALLLYLAAMMWISARLERGEAEEYEEDI